MNKLILAFAGEMGCGKGTAVKYLIEKYGGTSYKFSQILRDILDRLYIAQSRENLQNISTSLRKTFGEDLLAKAIFNDLKNSEYSLIVLDGVRRKDDIFELKKLPYFKFVYIDTSLENRYKRISKRGENSDDLTKTFSQFKIEQQGEAEIQIIGLRDSSNYVIDNNSDLDDLITQIDKIMNIEISKSGETN